VNKAINNYIVWIIVLFLEWFILKAASSANLWIFIAIPIIAAFIYTEYNNQPPKNRRNLR